MKLEVLKVMTRGKNQKQDQDKLELMLQQYEREQRDFENHWIWRQLDTTPKEFFEALKERMGQMNVPREKWLEIYGRVKESHRVRALEREKKYKIVDYKLMKAIRA